MDTPIRYAIYKIRDGKYVRVRKSWEDMSANERYQAWDLYVAEIVDKEETDDFA